MGRSRAAKVPGFLFVGKVLVPGSRDALTSGSAEIVDESGTEIVAANCGRAALSFNIELSDLTVGAGPGQRGAVEPETYGDRTTNGYAERKPHHKAEAVSQRLLMTVPVAGSLLTGSASVGAS